MKSKNIKKILLFVAITILLVGLVSAASVNKTNNNKDTKIIKETKKPIKTQESKTLKTITKKNNTAKSTDNKSTKKITTSKVVNNSISKNINKTIKGYSDDYGFKITLKDNVNGKILEDSIPHIQTTSNSLTIEAKLDPYTYELDGRYAFISFKHEKEYYDKKREIEKRRAEQAEAAFKKRMQITGTKDKQRELQIREEAVKQSQRAAEQEMADLEKEIQRKREKSKTQYLINYYQNMAEEKIKAFAEYLKTTVQPDTEKKIEEYLQTYDFRILTDIHRKQAELSKLENEFHSMDRKKQEETSKKYQEYLIFLNQLQVN